MGFLHYIISLLTTHPSTNEFDDTVVQPDVIILRDKSKLDPKGRGIIGAPDMVIEVISPSTTYNDRVLKHKKYMEAGVKEYWIVDPEHGTLDVYLLENGKYYSRTYGGDDVVPTLLGLDILLEEIFKPDDWNTADDSELSDEA